MPERREAPSGGCLGNERTDVKVAVETLGWDKDDQHIRDEHAVWDY